jgi:methionyl-tRNA formyltransferase
MDTVGDPIKVVLLINHDIGLNVFKYLLLDDKTKIVHIYIVTKNGEVNSEILRLCELHSIKFFVGKEILQDTDHLRIAKESKIDFAICVYWPWLLNDAYLSLCKDSLNFHPALLPENRGWYPHVHNILSGTSAGVTIHRMSLIADAGDIWGQKTTQIKDSDTAKDLYDRLKIDIYNLFSEIWPKIALGSISPIKQDENRSSYNEKNALDLIDEIDLDQVTSVKSTINLLRARTFGDKPFAYFLSNGKRVFVSIILQEEEDINTN